MTQTNNSLHLLGVYLLSEMMDHKQVIYLVCWMMIGGIEINTAGSRIRRARRESYCNYKSSGQARASR